MSIIAKGLIALIAALHLYIMWFEMFAWESRGPQVFGSFPAELFAQTTSMAANQGLYNGFLAAGLIWSLFIAQRDWAGRVATCFLIFVAVAGAYGALSVSGRILMVQTVPAMAALAAVHFLRPAS